MHGGEQQRRYQCAQPHRLAVPRTEDVQHEPTEQGFLIQRGKDKNGQQRQDHVGYCQRQ